MRLRYTPRKFAVHPEQKTLAIIEADHATQSAEQRQLGSNQANGSSTLQVSPVNHIHNYEYAYTHTLVWNNTAFTGYEIGALRKKNLSDMVLKACYTKYFWQNIFGPIAAVK